jgi:hypothetical protein
MASLADLFNPTFLMFLGILVLVVALLVVYFESKMREQNHKIASMLSLVSTLAEDMNGVKMGLNHLAIRGGNGFQQPDNVLRENLGNSETKLIEVSDDDESDNEDSDNEQTDNETNSEESDEINNDDLESLEDDSDTESESSTDDIKVVKLQVSNEDIVENELHEDANNLEFEPAEDLAEFEINDELPEISDDYVEEVLDLKYESEEKEEPSMPSASDLKTISINLGEEQPHEDNIDYKKLQLAKLRSIVVEKGLTSNTEAAKLKKHELLKLLGAE